MLQMSKLEEAASMAESGHPYPSFSMNIIVGSSQRNLELAQQPEQLRFRGQMPPLPSSSPEISGSKSEKSLSTPSSKKSSFSKAKSRMIERESGSVSKKASPTKEKSKGGDEEEDDDENPNPESKKSFKWTFSVFFEWIVLISFVGCLIASLTVKKLENHVFWGMEIWKWCVLVLVIFCGRMFTGWMMNVLIFLIRRKFLLNEKVLYFVLGMRKSVRFFAWLCLVLLAWILLVKRGVKRSKETSKILNDITRGLAGALLGAFLWLLKTLFVKIVAANFQCKRFFDRIKEAIFHQHVVEVLSGHPSRNQTSTSTSKMVFEFLGKKKGKREEVIKWLKKMKQEKASAWTMKGFADVLSTSKLSIVADDDDEDHKDKKITSELEARQAANKIFKRVAKTHTEGQNSMKSIKKDDLLPYFNEKEIEEVLALFEGAGESKEIKKKVLRDWLVEVYHERKSLACSLRDSKTAIEELNRLCSGVIVIVIILAWFLLMGLLTTKILVFLSSQLLLVAFMFGNTVKTLFEAIIFVFICHPFDVNDRCVIDGVQMIVEEMNLLNTVFLKFDNEKIYYPNSVLATKPIGNFYRSPDMGDGIDFAVDVSTTIDQIKALKEKIKEYLEKNPEFWSPNHNVIVKDFDDVNKMKMAFYFTHTMNFQNFGLRSSRRSDLILELKTILEDLQIKYHMLPLQAQLVGSPFPPHAR